ncbi:MAG TPA: DUF6600 domain-containing protein [Chthoniobacterales bacterium]|nr:DUF6600 domain-containing protein [Chthoniobacterales bacterium]
MKRFLLALTMVGFLLPLAPRAQAETEVSLNFFYDNLSPYGNWIEVGDYGYCFQPNVAVDSPDWRPYADGYWAYTDVGWTWVSYEDFGWATYHYGRWTDLADYGWVWIPGYEWGPAWVSWRTGGDYIGWAPLPPGGDVYEGSAITGQVDVQFDIGPLYYNFVDVRYIGEPVLRGRIFPPARNVTFINQTVNVTNITYNNSTVYNYGPNYNRLNEYSTRPIQRLSLQRETAVGGNFGQGGKHGNFSRVNGNQLVVVAPAIQKAPQSLAPRQVKAKVPQPKVEHGWQGIANRQQVQEEMKKENAQHVLPPTFQPQKGRKAEDVTRGQTAAAQPNEAMPANERNQQGEKAARQGTKNGPQQNAGAAVGAANENANPDAQASQFEQPNGQNAAREQKTRLAVQQRAEQQRKAQEENRARQPNAVKPAQSPVRHAERPSQAQRPQRPEQTEPPKPARPQSPPQERPAQVPNHSQRVQQPQPPPGEQNPNAPHKPKKKNPQDQKPDQPGQ